LRRLPDKLKANMTFESPTLTSATVRLEPLATDHLDALVAAAAVDPSLYQWSAVPVGREAVARYIETALAWREAGNAVPFATVRIADGAVLGSTRFFDIESWAWPAGHERHGRENPDVCEIGYTWLSGDAIRTAANTEAKLLMLTHAFEVWQVLRVCLHTDARNQRSQAAIERIGGKFEGVLRAHRMAADFTPRDSYRYSIVAAEWPGAKLKLQQRLDRS
jgi:RimJ/RimL family protein N-acetyltransferase